MKLETLLDQFPLPFPPARAIRLGIIGCGYVARECHVPAIVTLQNIGWPVEVAALCDLDSQRLADIQHHFPRARVYATATELFMTQCCDAVLVLVWPPLALELTREALATGLAVLVEKPVAKRANHLSALGAGDLPQKLQVAYNRKFQPLEGLWRKEVAPSWPHPASEMVVCVERISRGEEAFFDDVGVHPLSFLLSQCGPLTIKTASFGPRETPDKIPCRLEAELRTSTGLPISLRIRPSVGRSQESYEFLTRSETHRLDYWGAGESSAAVSSWKGGARTIHHHSSIAPDKPAIRTFYRGFLTQLAHFIAFAGRDDLPSPFSLADAHAVLGLWESLKKKAESSDRDSWFRAATPIRDGNSVTNHSGAT